jgi:hypothetical protein
VSADPRLKIRVRGSLAAELVAPGYDGVRKMAAQPEALRGTDPGTFQQGCVPINGGLEIGRRETGKEM